MQTRLKITSKGQVTLKKDLLAHLGVEPGDAVVVTYGPAGKASLSAVPRQGIQAFFGCIKNEQNIHLTLEEIDEAIKDGWAQGR